MIDTRPKPAAVVAAEPRRRVADALASIRSRVRFGGRRVGDGAVHSSAWPWRNRPRYGSAAAGQVGLPIVMTFVVAMFAATIALVWFGYVATREWRSGTNLLLERRANEALALVRAALSADMKGAWSTAIVPFNT